MLFIYFLIQYKKISRIKSLFATMHCLGCRFDACSKHNNNDMKGNDSTTQLRGLEFDPELWIHYDTEQDEAKNKMNE